MLNVRYRNLNFHWQRPLHLTEILIFHFPIFYLSLTFFSRTVMQFFLSTKWTMVVFFDLPIQWQSSISNVLILTLIWLKISITFSSNWSSGTLSGIPVRPGCYVYCTDPACSNQFPSLKYQFLNLLIKQWIFFKGCFNDGFFNLRENLSY